MKQWIEELLVWPTVALAVVSILSNIWVIISTRNLQLSLHVDQSNSELDKIQYMSHDFVIYRLIFWLATIDLIYSMNFITLFGINWTTVNAACIMLGIMGQFLSCCTSLWRILIASYLFYLLKFDDALNASSVTQENQIRQEFFSIFCKVYLRDETVFKTVSFWIFLICCVCSIIPLLWGNHNHYTILYNYEQDGETYGSECWVSGYFQMIFYSIVMISVLFDITVLMMAVCKYYKTKRYTNAYLYLTRRLLMWVIIFLIIRIFPFFDRLLALVLTNYNTPLWLVLLHNYSLASVGIANGIVWYLTRKITPDSQIYKHRTGINTDINAKMAYLLAQQQNAPQF